MSRSIVALPALFSLLSLACATPRLEPLPMSPLQAKAGERVVVDHAALIFDSSGSIDEPGDFPREKALFESFVAGMPEGGYEAGSVAFGGYLRQTHPIGAFDRGALMNSAREIRYLSEGTPLDTIFREVGTTLEGKGKRAAVVLFSDGLPTDAVGREFDPERAIDAARTLADGYDGQVCFHTVQVGDDVNGEAFLRKLAGLSDCGSWRRSDTTRQVAALGGFEREVFLGTAPAPAPPPIVRAPAPGDADGDGVTDDIDECPNTPPAAVCDARGCWSIPWLEFATDSAELQSGGRRRLESEVLPVLQHSPEMHVRIDGHTDARGSDVYNQSLSERRSQSVVEFLVARGVSRERLEAKGWGEAKPIAPNDTASNLQRNRRTELTILQ